MKCKYLLLALLVMPIFLLMLQSVSAVDQNEVIYGFKQSTTSTLRHPCFDSGSYCSAAFSCNLSISFSDTGSVIVNNGAMTYDGGYFKYNLTQTQTATTGYYKTDMVCFNGGLNGTDTFYYQVTPSGSGNIKQDYFLPIALFVLAITILIFALVTKNEYFGFISGAVFIILGIYIMLNGFGDFNGQFIRNTAYVVIGFGLIIFLAAAYEAITSSNNSLIGGRQDSGDDF